MKKAGDVHIDGDLVLGLGGRNILNFWEEQVEKCAVKPVYFRL